MARRTMDVLECDNPHCRHQEVVNDIPNGIFIAEGWWATDEGGGPLREVYACSLACLPAAVGFVQREREWDGPWPEDSRPDPTA